MNVYAKQKQTHRYRKPTYGYKRAEGGWGKGLRSTNYWDFPGPVTRPQHRGPWFNPGSGN